MPSLKHMWIVQVEDGKFYPQSSLEFAKETARSYARTYPGQRILIFECLGFYQLPIQPAVPSWTTVIPT